MSTILKKPNESCTSKEECIEGLYCNSLLQCSCPSPCVYQEDMEVCDCGEVHLQAPEGVFAAGVILTLISVIFWCTVIIKRIKRRSHSRRNVDVSQQGTTNRSNLNADPFGNNARLLPYSLDPLVQEPVIQKKDSPPSYDEATKNNPIPEKRTLSASTTAPDSNLIPPSNINLENIPNVPIPSAPPVSPDPPAYSEVDKLPYSLDPFGKK